MGFNRPSKIQETALPMLLSRHTQNLIAQSQSGTGKTAAFVLTMLSRIDLNLDYPQCLCLSPTYEVKIFKGRTHGIFTGTDHNFSFKLALQTGKVMETMGAAMKNLKICYALKGLFSKLFMVSNTFKMFRNSTWTWRKSTWPNCDWYTGNLYGLGR